MEVSQEEIPHPTGNSGKAAKADIHDSVDEIFWDAHWTLDDDDQPADTALALL